MFPDFSVEDAVQLLKLQLRKQYGLELSSEATAQLPALMTKVRRQIQSSTVCDYMSRSVVTLTQSYLTVKYDAVTAIDHLWFRVPV